MDTGEWPARCLRPLQGDPRAAALVAHGKEVAQRGRPRTELTHTGSPRASAKVQLELIEEKAGALRACLRIRMAVKCSHQKNRGILAWLKNDRPSENRRSKLRKICRLPIDSELSQK
jgi:hypothetical protein